MQLDNDLSRLFLIVYGLIRIVHCEVLIMSLFKANVFLDSLDASLIIE